MIKVEGVAKSYFNVFLCFPKRIYRSKKGSNLAPYHFEIRVAVPGSGFGDALFVDIFVNHLNQDISQKTYLFNAGG